jgi:DNA-binding Lrp family transcriptional regulator
VPDGLNWESANHLILNLLYEPILLMIDDIDKRIINRIQSDFPVTARPFRTIAADLDLQEDDVIQRVTRLRKSGIIRRIGGNFVPEKLGYVSTLCAASVPDDKLEHFKQVVNSYTGVTHNYRRENHFNVWFTFIAPSRTIIKENLEDISRRTGVKGILNLPATRVYKIKAEFTL